MSDAKDPLDDSKGGDYVSELRAEAASWRKKFRDTESQLAMYQQAEKDFVVNDRISKELSKRNVKDVEPTWVDIQEGQEAAEAVDSFLEKHPRFKMEAENVDPQPVRRGATTKPLDVNKTNTNVPSIGPVRDILSIKEDPQSRAKLRDTYRALIAQQSNTGLTI